MDIALWIFFGFICVMVLACFVIAGIAVVQQRRTPLDERKRQVLEELQKNEGKTGSTSILSNARSGVNDDMVRELAQANGYQWTGYSGLNDRQLNFRRNLPGRES